MLALLEHKCWACAREGSWVSRPRVIVRPAMAEGTAIPLTQSWALVSQHRRLQTRSGRCWDHTVPVTHTPSGASLIRQGRGVPEKLGLGWLDAQAGTGHGK